MYGAVRSAGRVIPRRLVLGTTSDYLYIIERLLIYVLSTRAG